MDTIFALSTAPGKSGVAVIRVSGPQALDATQKICGDVPPFRTASLRDLTDQDGTHLDQALVLTFQSGASFTGEDCAEFQIHGSAAVISAILSVLGSFRGLRPALPGEFSRRAMENGQLDLTQIEGLADLLEAETEAQRRQALKVLAGDLKKCAEEWRLKLIRAAALIEATIDFADEDVPEDVSPEVLHLIAEVQVSLEQEISGTIAAESIRSGFEVAIVGAPNVGKSTLLNALAGRDAAITSEFAGTTRDVIEVRLDLNGIPVTLLDTAGVRETDDFVEAIGVERTLERARSADLRVFLITPDEKPEIQPGLEDLVFLAKADLNGNLPGSISGVTGFGLSQLTNDIAKILEKRTAGVRTATRIRHKIAMEEGVSALRNAQEQLSFGDANADLSAEELRSAIRALDSLVGRIDVENVLDEIFSSFCLGK